MPRDCKPSFRIMRRMAPWAGAAFLSIALNLILFGLMPALISGRPDKIETSSLLRQVNIVRMKREESPPVRKKAERTPSEQPLKKAAARTNPDRQLVAAPQNLPFEINPKLPALPGMPAGPAMAGVSFRDQGLPGAFDIGEIDGPLMPLSQSPPLYPYRAKRLGIEGWVKVQFVVNEKGKTEQIRIVSASPENIFEQNVLRCISSWRFRPGTIGGEPVRTLVSTTVKFELD